MRVYEHPFYVSERGNLVDQAYHVSLNRNEFIALGAIANFIMGNLPEAVNPSDSFLIVNRIASGALCLQNGEKDEDYRLDISLEEKEFLAECLKNTLPLYTIALGAVVTMDSDPQGHRSYPKPMHAIENVNRVVGQLLEIINNGDFASPEGSRRSNSGLEIPDPRHEV